MVDAAGRSDPASVADEPGASTCRLCGEPVARLVVDLGSQPIADDVVHAPDPEPPRRPLRLLRCNACGLLQTAAVGHAPDLRTHGHGSLASKSLAAHLRAWGEALARELHTGDRVLDVTPSNPALHAPLLAAGGVLLGSNEAGELDPAAIDDVIARSGPAHLVIANHALAHTDDLRGLLRALRDALGNDGRLAVEAHHALAILEGDQVDVVSHAHRSYLSLEVLRRALTDVGFELVDASRSPAYGGTLRVLAMPAGSASGVPAGAGERVAAIVGAEADAGLTDGAGLEMLAARAEAGRGRLRAFLEAERADGRRVAGYGAPGRAVTLLNWAGVGATLLPWTVDRSEAKQGGRIPGTAIEVREPETLELEPVDTILILAWTLADELRVQLAPLVARGARLAVAAPEPGFIA